MDKAKYLEQRNRLLAEVEGLIDNGKIEESNAKMKEVEDLDTQFEADAKANANLNALKDNVKVKNLEDNSVKNLKGGLIVDTNKIEIENLLKSEDYRNGYFKRLQGKELTQQENAAVSAASVIPTTTMNKIIEKIEQTSVLYNKISVTNIPGKISIPRENVKDDANWVAMATPASDGGDSFDAVSLGANKLIKTIEISADVEAMSIDAFEGFVVNALSKKMSKAIDNSILNGTGTEQPTGLLLAGQVTATGTYTKLGMTYKDLLAILAALPTGYHPNATFVTTRQVFFGDVLGMSATDGSKIVVPDVQSPARYNILGYNVVIDDYMTTDTILFGDLSYYYFNWAKAVAIEFDKSCGFRTGSTVYRGLALADGKPALAEAFVKYTRAAA